MQFDLKSRVRDRNQLEVTLSYTHDSHEHDLERQQLDLEFFLFNK